MKHEITPASSPDLKVEFVVPRDGKKDLEFALTRVEYIRDFQERWIKFIGERMKPVPVLDDAGEPVLDEAGEPKTKDAERIEDHEFLVENFRCAGLPATIIKQLDALTLGELREIYDVWTSASKVKPGESQGSAAS